MKKSEKILQSFDEIVRVEAKDELFDAIYSNISKSEKEQAISPVYFSLLKYAAVILILFSTVNVALFISKVKLKTPAEQEYSAEDFLKEYQVIRYVSNY